MTLDPHARPSLQRFLLSAVITVATLSSLGLGVAQNDASAASTWDAVLAAFRNAGFGVTGCGTAFNDLHAACSYVDGQDVDAVGDNLEAFRRTLGIELDGSTPVASADGDRVVWPWKRGEVSIEISSMGDDALWLQVIFTPPVANPRPDNDHYFEATELHGSSGTATGTNRGASTIRGEPDYFDNPGGQGVWWKWRAPADGSVTFETRGSSFDTVLDAYDIHDEDERYQPRLTPLASNDDVDDLGLGSRIQFDVQAGALYAVRVGGYEGDSGDVVISWTMTTP